MTFHLPLPRLKCYAFTKEAGDLSQDKQPILQALNLPRLYEVPQVHGNALSEYTELKPSDGIYTDRPHIPLFIRTGDCQAALFYDPVKDVLALSHAGWRGQEKRIYTHTIMRLKERYGTEARDLLVGVAPSIGAESFEFKENVPPFLLEHAIGNNRYDLKKAAKKELLEAGIQESRIEIAPECTYRDERFHSYRRDKTEKRQGLIAWMCR